VYQSGQVKAVSSHSLVAAGERKWVLKCMLPSDKHVPGGADSYAKAYYPSRSPPLEFGNLKNHIRGYHGQAFLDLLLQNNNAARTAVAERKEGILCDLSVHHRRHRHIVFRFSHLFVAERAQGEIDLAAGARIAKDKPKQASLAASFSKGAKVSAADVKNDLVALCAMLHTNTALYAVESPFHREASSGRDVSADTLRRRLPLLHGICLSFMHLSFRASSSFSISSDMGSTSSVSNHHDCLSLVLSSSSSLTRVAGQGHVCRHRQFG